MKIKSLIKLRTKVSPETSVEKVWQLLARRDITLVPVVSAGNEVVGVIGEDDLLYRLVPDYRDYFSEFLNDIPTLKDIEEKLSTTIKLAAADVMNRKVVAVYGDQPVFKALSKMMAYNIRSMPVVDDQEKYIGTVIEDDIMEYLFKKHTVMFSKRK